MNYIHHGNYTDFIDYVEYIKFLGSIELRQELRPTNVRSRNDQLKVKNYTISKKSFKSKK